MQSPEIVLYTGNNNNSEVQQKWDLYSRYIFRGSDLLNKTSDTQPRCTNSEYEIHEHIPEQIRSMLAMYKFGDGSFRQKCLNFINQAKYMEDYEDDAPWYGNLMICFPVYHDLNVRQLRGYFTWRTQIRKGHFSRTCSSFAYLYIYELLNGIGTCNASDSFAKLQDFRHGYTDTDMGDITMKGNLRRWLFEFAVTHAFPAETAFRFVDAGVLERDHALSVLQDPGNFDDEEVFQAIRRFSSSKTAFTIVTDKDRKRGVRLFAEIWRHIAALSTLPFQGGTAEKDLFTICFGEKESRPWHPLANAVYIDQREADDLSFQLDECRRYFCHKGEWQVESYNSLSGDRTAFMALMHSADRRIRTLLRSGHYLHQKKGDDWAMPFIDDALREIQEEEIEAARPKISLDLSGLDKIREDADITRDSLLTEEETGLDDTHDIRAAGGEQDIMADEHAAMAGGHEVIAGEHADDACEQPLPFGLDAVQTAVLRMLLDGRSADALIAVNHLMTSVVADSINEALFDEIGDNVVECTDDGLVVVEDYAADLKSLVGGNVQ